MKLRKIVKKSIEETVLIGAAALAILMLEYEKFINKRNKWK